MFRSGKIYFLSKGFLSLFYVHVFSCKISSSFLFLFFKYPYSCFSSHFCFLVIIVLLICCLCCYLIAVINLSLLFYVVFESLNWCINTIFNTGESSSTLFSLKNSLSSHFTLGIVDIFLVLRSICWSSSPFHFKNGLEYLTRETILVFIPFDAIPTAKLGFEKCFLSSEIHFYNFFLLYPLVWWCPLPLFPSACTFPFLRTFTFFLDLTGLFFPLFVFFYPHY